MEDHGAARTTVEELQSMTVVKLRQRLAQYGIPQSGNKAALVERLDKFYNDRDAKTQDQQPQSVQCAPPQHYGDVPIQEDNLHVQQQLQLQLQQQQEQQLQLLQQQQQQQQLAAEQAAIQERQRQEDAWRQQQLAAAQAADQQRLLQEEHARAVAEEQERRHQEEVLRQRQLADQAAVAERERHMFEQQERERLEAHEALRQQQIAAQAAAEEQRHLQIRLEEEGRRRLQEEHMRQQIIAAEAAAQAAAEEQRQLQIRREREERRRLQEEHMRQQIIAAEAAAERQRQMELHERERKEQDEMIRRQQMEMQAAAERERQEQAEAEAESERQNILLEEKRRLEAEQRYREDQKEAQRAKEEAYQKQLEQELKQRHIKQDAELKQLEEADKSEGIESSEDTAHENEMGLDNLISENEEHENNKKQPLFRASIGGMRSMTSQARPSSVVSNDAEDLDGQSTPAGPMPKSRGGPVPLMSLEIKPPSPQAAIPVEDDSKLPTKDNNSALPKALEQALALKTERAHEMGVHPEDIAQVESELIGSSERGQEENKNVGFFEEPEVEEIIQNKGKQRSKGKKKKKKKNRPQEWARQAEEAERRRKEDEEHRQIKKETHGEQPDIEVEYIQDKLELDMSDPMYRQFSKIFEVFKIAENEEEVTIDKDTELEKDESEDKNEDTKKVPHMLEDDDMVEEDEQDENKDKLSKRKLKKLNRLSVAELKQLVSRPDVVEMHDVTAKDPNLLVSLKATRNTVPVPRHWCFKRKYLQGKRGIEKAAFDLPDFIKKTGIMEMRAALQEKEVEKNMKSKMREKVRPKLGKIDIDYQKLHDAFFKWQTKPRMTYHGDLYYEGKEFEIRLKEKKPGDLSDDLRTALGMPVGPNAHKVPPPWLIAMQRYGPPPSYPNLKIPGLNAPIPEGCSFGYHAGGWGKPPVDEIGKPLYGDVFGTADAAYAQQMTPEEIDTTLWGEMESESEEEESSEEEEDEEDEQAEDERIAGAQTPLVGEGLATPSGMSSVGIGGLGQETPELLELRKKKIEAEMEGGETPNLYTVLPERRNERIGASMMGSTHTYDLGQAGISGARQAQIPVGGGSGTGLGGVEMALNPEEVDLMDTEAMAAKAEAALRDQQANLAKEDLSDMVAEHAAKAANKRKRLANKDEGKSNKKYKEFKF